MPPPCGSPGETDIPHPQVAPVVTVETLRLTVRPRAEAQATGVPAARLAGPLKRRMAAPPDLRAPATEMVTVLLLPRVAEVVLVAGPETEPVLPMATPAGRPSTVAVGETVVIPREAAALRPPPGAPVVPVAEQEKVGRVVKAIDTRRHVQQPEIGAPVATRITVPSARTAAAERAEAEVGAGVAPGAAPACRAGVGAEPVGLEVGEVIGRRLAADPSARVGDFPGLRHRERPDATLTMYNGYAINGLSGWWYL